MEPSDSHHLSNSIREKNILICLPSPCKDGSAQSITAKKTVTSEVELGNIISDALRWGIFWQGCSYNE